MYPFRDNRYAFLTLLGFFSGLPAALFAGTLQAWFTETGLDLRLIGGVTLLVLPFSLRFFWAPFLDEFRLPWMDRRRGWLLLIQTGILLSTTVMAMLSPLQRIGSLPWLLVPGFVLSFLSASQDIVINAWQAEMFTVKERGLSAGLYVAGWRMGAIVSGGLALLMADRMGWHRTYLIMALLMVPGLLVVCLMPHGKRDRLPKQQSPVAVMLAAIRLFFQKMGSKAAIFLLLVILTYKLGDALALALNTTFLLREAGFSLATLGLVNKSVSLVSALFGGIVGGVWMRYLTLRRALLLFAGIQAFSHVGYVAIALTGHHVSLLVLAAFLEHFCSGMGTVALMAFIMDLSVPEYAATQIALFNALAYLPRIVVGPIAACWVDALGWVSFFAGCMLASLVPCVLLLMSGKALRKM